VRSNAHRPHSPNGLLVSHTCLSLLFHSPFPPTSVVCAVLLLAVPTSPSASAFAENNGLLAPGRRGSYTLGEQLTLIPHLLCPPVPALGTRALFPYPSPFPLALLFDFEPPPLPPAQDPNLPSIPPPRNYAHPTPCLLCQNKDRKTLGFRTCCNQDGRLSCCKLSHLLQSGWFREREVTDFRQGLYTPIHPPLFSYISGEKHTEAALRK